MPASVKLTKVRLCIDAAAVKQVRLRWLWSVRRETSQRVRHECALVSGGLFDHGRVSSASVSLLCCQTELPPTVDAHLSASVPSLTEISGMLHTSRPDNGSDVLLQLHTAPNCHYRVTFVAPYLGANCVLQKGETSAETNHPVGISF